MTLKRNGRAREVFVTIGAVLERRPQGSERARGNHGYEETLSRNEERK